MRKNNTIAKSYKLKGDMLNLAFATLKDILPAITRYKTKTENNSIILGKWQKKK
tara:strand:- start:196 stop:357 length:162 start_codon:yes stop_codon:yes gene_type:complete